MRQLLLALPVLLVAALPARADDDVPPPAASSQPARKPVPQPDIDRPVTITLRKLNAMLAAAHLQGEAQALTQGVQADLQDLQRQAMPPADPTP